MRAALVLIALAGCYNDAPGMRLVIRDPGFGADHVELFIATRHAEIGKVGADKARETEPRVKLPGDSFFLDGPEDGITPVTRLDFSGKRVVWDLRADVNTEIKLLIAVAFDANNTAIAVAKMANFQVPANDTVAAVLDLEDAKQMPPSETAMPDGLRVWLWRKSNAASAACLALEYSDGRDVERKWLVPEDDPDCDEMELECDAHFWHADGRSASATPDNVNCLDGLQNGASPIKTLCRAGTRTCVDGMPPGLCSPLAAPTYCVSNAICNAPTCMAAPSQCMNNVPSTSYDCFFAVAQDGSMCDDGVGNGPMHVKLKEQLPNGCTNVQFTPFDVTVAGIRPMPTITIGNAMLAIANFSPVDCEFDVVLTGFAPNLVNEPILVAVDVTLTMDHVILPLFIQFLRNSCTQTGSVCTRRDATGEALGDCN